jgi:hypothetical protein
MFHLLVTLSSRKGRHITLGYSIVEKVEVSQYRYDTDTILAVANLAIGYPMQLVVDGHLGIKPLGIDCHWQKFPADAKNGSR